jgi:hypothetical protein
VLQDFIDEDKGKLILGIPENIKSSLYSEMTLNEFILAHYTCGNQPIVLQIRGPTLGYREFMVEKSIAKVAYDWIQHAKMDMIWYMLAEAGKAIFHNYETLQLMTSCPSNQIHLK